MKIEWNDQKKLNEIKATTKRTNASKMCDPRICCLTEVVAVLLLSPVMMIVGGVRVFLLCVRYSRWCDHVHCDITLNTSDDDIGSQTNARDNRHCCPFYWYKLTVKVRLDSHLYHLTWIRWAFNTYTVSYVDFLDQRRHYSIDNTIVCCMILNDSLRYLYLPISQFCVCILWTIEFFGSCVVTRSLIQIESEKSIKIRD